MTKAKTAIVVLSSLLLAAWPFALSEAIATVKALQNRVSSIMRRKWLERRVYTYKSAEEEQAYWVSSEPYRERLRKSDARHLAVDPAHRQKLPLSATVSSYAAALPPATRCRRRNCLDCSEYYLSAKNYCKWHKMVFRGSVRSSYQHHRNEFWLSKCLVSSVIQR
ncbi:hypothetical protein HGRIS_009013 [Hohenbuehelia grisea]|uniref:Uncharacterized protein n=1 Tax=Hohenbuehelia grisea TaxID=104357 RepID=A0ABR3IZW6_9AGAR